jgi:shikimate dehydrogenase
MTDRYAVIGNPVAHSRSPEIHAMFARQTGQKVEYIRLLSPLDGFRTTVQAFVAEGGRGANVTIPFKLEAFDLAHQASPRAKAARAANFLQFGEEHIQADNTDGFGLLRDITVNLDFGIRGKRVLLMGAGGAVQGVLLPLLEEHPVLLTLVNRTPEKAVRLAESARHLAAAGQTVVSGMGYPELRGKHFDLVINATSSSLSNERLPLPEGLFAHGALAYEMMYGKGLTPFLAYAAEQGVGRMADGLGMLVEQAAESFRLWRGVEPQTRPVIEALRTA